MKKLINLLSLNKTLNSDDIHNVLMPYNTDIVYLGGSLIEGSINPYGRGMGNVYSDIDVFIVRNHENYIVTKGEYNEKIKKTDFYTTPNGISFDIEIYDRDCVDNVIELLESSEININERVLNYIDFPEGWNMESANSFFCRIKNSICIYNEDAYEKIIAKINFGKFIHIYKYFLMNGIDNIVQDVMGNEKANQIETALLCAREACYHLMGIILLNEEQMYDRKKWLFIKFKNLVETKSMYVEELESCRQLFFGQIDEHEEAERMIHKFLGTMEKSLENIMIGVDF